MGALLDSSFLVDLLRNQQRAHELLRKLEAEDQQILLSTPVVYELLSGLRLEATRAAGAKVEAVISGYPVLPFDLPAARRASEVRSELLRMRTPIRAVDTMLAGLGLAYGHQIVSRDTGVRGLSSVFGLTIRDY
ncbi:MAG: PIN domain-containing protein [Thermoplasmata archaeon]|nr:PIN domain-containing protein [Thermoplasmata archaeon]